MKRNTIICGDVIETLATFPAECIDCCVTSPPYWGLRDYGSNGQIGLEPTLEEYLERLTRVFNEVKRVLKPDGTLWLNLGDSYNAYNGGAGSSSKLSKTQSEQRPDLPTGYGLRSKALKPKDLTGQPWRLAFALQADGWYLRSDIIWSKPNPMPESVTDRPTKAHEYVFLMTKSTRYFYDADAVRESSQSGPSDIRKMLESKERIGGKHKGLDDSLNKASKYTNIGQKRAVGNPSGRNKRTVWEIATQPMPSAHFATFPEKLVEPCILAGTSERGYCSECGKPWGRVVEKSGGTIGKGDWNSHVDDGEILASRYAIVGTTSDGSYKREPKGWEAGCNCNADTVPGLVLDPFMGSGTVALVAHRLDRDFVGIELSPEYCEIAHKRIDEETSQGRLFAGG